MGGSNPTHGVDFLLARNISTSAALDPGVIGNLVGSDRVWSKSIEHHECPVGMLPKAVENGHTLFA